MGKSKKTSQMDNTDPEDEISKLMKHVNELEHYKQQEQIRHLCKNSSSDTQLLKLRDKTKLLHVRSPLKDRV